MRPGENGGIIFEGELEAGIALAFVARHLDEDACRVIANHLEPPLPPDRLGRLPIIAARLGLRQFSQDEYSIKDSLVTQAVLDSLELARSPGLPDIFGKLSVYGFLRHGLEKYEKTLRNPK